MAWVKPTRMKKRLAKSASMIAGQQVCGGEGEVWWGAKRQRCLKASKAKLCSCSSNRRRNLFTVGQLEGSRAGKTAAVGMLGSGRLYA